MSLILVRTLLAYYSSLKYYIARVPWNFCTWANYVIQMFDSKSLDIQWVKGQIAADIGKEGCLFKFYVHVATCQNITCTKADILEYLWCLKQTQDLAHLQNQLPFKQVFWTEMLSSPPKRTPTDSCTSNCALTNMNWLCCTVISRTVQLTLQTQDIMW